MKGTIVLLLTLSMLSSCTSGFLYTDKTYPLTRNMNRTPRGGERGKGATYSLKIPLSNTNVSAEWNTRALGDIARQHRIKSFSYADLHTFSLLGGIYKKEEVKLYGEKE